MVTKKVSTLSTKGVRPPAEFTINVNGVTYRLFQSTPYMKIETPSELQVAKGHMGFGKRLLQDYYVGAGATETQAKKDALKLKNLNNYYETKIIRSEVNNRYYLYTCNTWELKKISSKQKPPKPSVAPK